MRRNDPKPTTIPALTASELANLRLKAGVAQQTAESAQAAVDSIYDDPHAWTATQDFSRVTSGVGEQYSPYHGDLGTSGPHHEGSIVNIELGTTAAPDTLLQTPLKVSRVMKITDADLVAIGIPVTSTGDQYLASIAGFNKGTANCTVQVTGVYGAGINYGTTNAPEMSGARPDAAGLMGMGTTFGPGGGIGAYLEGRRYNASGYASALEMQVRNLAGAGNPVAYDPLNHASCGTWLVAGGDADLGCGHLIGHISAVQFDIGFGILGTVVSGKTGGVRVASFRDDGNATTVFDINGSHTNGLDASGATFSNHAILMAAGHTQSWGDVGLERSSAGMLGVTDGAAGSGSITADTLRLTSTVEATLASTGHAFQIGPDAGTNLILDTNEIQGRNTGTASPLNLNPHGGGTTIEGVHAFSSTGASIGAALEVSGNATLGDAATDTVTVAGLLRLTNTAETTLISTDHALQIGPSTGVNLAADVNEIQARNNGAASTLELNPHGGSVTVGGVALGTVATQTYAEGTWTPSLNFGGSSTGMTYSDQFGRYTKIGRVVFFEVRIILTAKGTATGTAVISGLPFTSAATASTSGNIRANNMTTVASAQWLGISASTNLSLYDFTGSAQVSLTHADFTDTSSMIFEGFYST